MHYRINYINDLPPNKQFEIELKIEFIMEPRVRKLISKAPVATHRRLQAKINVPRCYHNPCHTNEVLKCKILNTLIICCQVCMSRPLLPGPASYNIGVITRMHITHNYTLYCTGLPRVPGQLVIEAR